MLTLRQETILKIIVENYINTVEPVSSNCICDVLDVSSATVRNEMAILEKNGLIEKTHFASGRVPTEMGYRYYVDYITNQNAKRLNEVETTQIRALFANDGLVLKDAIYESVKLISELTNYSVVMLGGHSKLEKLQEVKVVAVDNHSVVSIIITNTGKVFNQTVLVDEELNLKELEEVVQTINGLLVGTPLNQINAKLEQEIKPVLKRFIDQHTALYEAFLDSIRVLAKKDVKFEGQDKLLYQPEFDDIDVIRKFISQMNDEAIIELLNNNSEIDVRIGHDSNILDDLSVITTCYDTGSDEASIAVIGPKRMDYNRVIGLLEEIKSNLDKISEGKVNESEQRKS